MPARRKVSSPRKNYNWPKLIAALISTFTALVALAIDADSLSRYHVSLLEDMSSRTAWSYGTCFRYSSRGSSEALFAGDGLKQNAFLNRQNTFGSTGVCKDFKDTAAKTLIANVHALRYMAKAAPYNSSTSDMFTAVSVAYGAILGQDVYINVDTLSSAMSALSGVPDTCEDIYSRDPVDPDLKNATAPSSFEANAIKLPNVECGNTFNYSTQVAIKQSDSDEMMYAMCIEQFSYLRSRSDQTVDNVPYPGTLFEPSFKPLEMLLPSKWNDTLYWDKYTRIVSGVRLGWAAWAATPSIMLSSFMFMDGVCCILSEMTRGARMRAIRARASSSEDIFRQVTRIEANAAATRSTRFVFCIIAFIVCAVMRVVFVWLPWFGPDAYFVKPICLGSGAGWEDNRSEQIADIVVMGMQLVAIFLYWISSCFRIGEDPNRGEDIQIGEGVVKADVKFTKYLWFIIALFTLLQLALQAVVANVFGLAWAEEIIDPNTYDWNANKLAEVVATRVIASAAFASFGGFSLGAVMGRFVVQSSVSKPALCTFFCWVGIAFVSAGPLLLMNVADVSEKDKFLEDCVVLYTGTFAKAACEFRQMSLIINLGAIGLVFAIIIVSGFWTNIRALSNDRITRKSRKRRA